jgi:hypothetical protein
MSDVRNVDDDFDDDEDEDIFRAAFSSGSGPGAAQSTGKVKIDGNVDKSDPQGKL